MQRTVRAYEKPSRISQGLVVCLSIAVVLAGGRLASTIILSRYATASAVHGTNMTSAPVSVESVSSEPPEPPVEPPEPPVAARVNSTYFEPLARDDASAAPTPPRSALPLAPLAEPPSAATHNPGFAPWSTATSVPDVDFRGIPAKLPYPPPQAAEGTVTSVPVPRPRPRVESEDVQPDPDQSPFSAFDLFIGRQR
jgi:hypothetical protein